MNISLSVEENLNTAGWGNLYSEIDNDGNEVHTCFTDLNGKEAFKSCVKGSKK